MLLYGRNLHCQPKAQCNSKRGTYYDEILKLYTFLALALTFGVGSFMTQLVYFPKGVPSTQ